MNSKGVSTVPCGTPDSMAVGSAQVLTIPDTIPVCARLSCEALYQTLYRSLGLPYLHTSDCQKMKGRMGHHTSISACAKSLFSLYMVIELYSSKFQRLALKWNEYQ